MALASSAAVVRRAAAAAAVAAGGGSRSTCRMAAAAAAAAAGGARPALRAVHSATHHTHDAPVVVTRDGGAATVALNRPKALNSLNVEMVRLLGDAVARWHGDASLAVVVLKGLGGKAFCAGGDIKGLWDGRGSAATAAKQDAFFREEYTVDHALAMASTTATPHVALYDGIVMGGGVGISINATFRVATERALFAMPETGIGLFPDVGGSYFLPRLPDAFGTYLALTGHRLKGADLVHAGVASHYVPAASLPALERDLAAVTPGSDAADRVAGVLHRYATPAAALPPYAVAADTRALIRDAFAGDSVEDIVAALSAAGARGAAPAAAMVATMARMSPTSMKVTLEQMRRGAALSLADCYRMELRMALRFMEGHDFFEGVRALLVDKDSKPVWRPASLAEVSRDAVAAYFAPLPADKELVLP